jgi:hypothetical protein
MLNAIDGVIPFALGKELNIHELRAGRSTTMLAIKHSTPGSPAV